MAEWLNIIVPFKTKELLSANRVGGYLGTSATPTAAPTPLNSLL